MENRITAILENYLETIYILETKNNKESKNVIRVTDIAKLTGRSKASVNIAIKSLVSMGYINHEHYGNIELTPAGREIGIEIAKRHSLFYTFLVKVLNVEESIADEEACKIEHTLSKDTVMKFRDFLCKYCQDNELEE